VWELDGTSAIQKLVASYSLRTLKLAGNYPTVRIASLANKHRIVAKCAHIHVRKRLVHHVGIACKKGVALAGPLHASATV
jgi:hypothetical protein